MAISMSNRKIVKPEPEEEPPISSGQGGHVCVGAVFQLHGSQSIYRPVPGPLTCYDSPQTARKIQDTEGAAVGPRHRPPQFCAPPKHQTRSPRLQYEREKDLLPLPVNTWIQVASWHWRLHSSRRVKNIDNVACTLYRPACCVGFVSLGSTHCDGFFLFLFFLFSFFFLF